MFVRRLEDVKNSDHTIDGGDWISRRLVVASDNADFSVHDTIVKAGAETNTWYKHHIESVYCIEGEGEIEQSSDAEKFAVRPGTLCLLNKHEQHVLRATTDMRLICVMSPPLVGYEQLDAEGNFPALAKKRALRKRNIFVVGLNDFNLRSLSSIRNADNYEYVPLLDPKDVLGRDEYPIDEILAKARKTLADFNAPIDGLVHYIDFPVSTIVPMLCRHLGLPSASLEAVLKCEHKFWSRVEQEKVIPEHVPEFRAFDPFDDGALKKIGMPFPFWVKPIKSFSSYLGFRIKDETDWNHAIKEIRANIGRFAGPFDKLLENVELPEAVAGIGGGHCLAEAIIGGRQCTQEGFSHKGRVVVYGTVDSLREPNGSSFSSYQYPSRLPATVRKRMSRITEKYIKAVGYDNAPFNVEYFWDANEDKIWMLEVNTRISESHTDLFWKVDGASHHEIAVDLSLGVRPRLPYRDGDFAAAGKFFIRRYKDGVVRKAPDEAAIKKVQEILPGTVVRIIPKEGDRLSDLMDQDSYSYVLALMWIGASNHHQLQRRYEKAVELLSFEFEDD